MGVVDHLASVVDMYDDVWIPAADGVLLAARIWRPVGSEKAPVPAILEFLPYRRRDGTAQRDALTHPYFAAHGYASVRVDMRGSGDSEGVLHGEYLKQEQDDAITILSWLEAQPWCSGSVGMIGISWGGFNGLQVAARRPRQLKAVISICSTDDRYADDIHFMGGALLLDKLGWGSTMFSMNAAPPDPAVVGDAWRQLWMKRLNESGFWLADWLAHQRRDAFYKHGSVCENWDAIECPVYAVGGWSDGYTNAIGRLLDNLKGPRKGLIGPWAHKYPHFAKPGPQIGFLQECLRWWDHWLKGKDTRVMDGPMLRAWIEEPARPNPYNEMKPGRWVAEQAWPGHGGEPLRFALSPGRLGGKGYGSATISSPQNTGLAAGKWCPYGLWADQPLDQRQEIGGQAIFDTAPLESDIDMLGTPRVTLKISSDKPNALIAATLCEVFPDGASTRVSYGILNLTHRDSHEMPEAMVPSKTYDVSLNLCDIGHSFGRGNRIRLSLSNAYWPIVWPSPEANMLTVDCRASELSLPVRQGKDIDQSLQPFAEPESAAPLAQTEIEPGHNSWTVHYDAMTNTTVLERINSDGWHRINGIDLELGTHTEYRYTIKSDDPLSARLETHYVRRYRRGSWGATLVTDIALSSTATDFLLNARLEAREGEEAVKTETWSLTVPRDHV